MSIDSDSSFDVNALFGGNTRKQIINKLPPEIKPQEDVIINKPTEPVTETKDVEVTIQQKIVPEKPKVAKPKVSPKKHIINNAGNTSVDKLKDYLKNSISYDTLSKKLPVLIIAYFDTLYERTGTTVDVQGKVINVTSIAYGPFYNDIDLREWISKLQENYSKKTFVHFEVYSLDTVINQVSFNAIIDKIDTSKLSIGNITYGDRVIDILK